MNFGYGINSHLLSKRSFFAITVNVPNMGDSISEGTLVEWINTPAPSSSGGGGSTSGGLCETSNDRKIKRSTNKCSMFNNI